MGDFHTTSMCRFMVATQAALWPLATAPAATRHRRMQEAEKEQLYAFDYSSLSALRDIKRVFNNRLVDYFTEKGVSL